MKIIELVNKEGNLYELRVRTSDASYIVYGIIQSRKQPDEISQQIAETIFKNEDVCILIK